MHSRVSTILIKRNTLPHRQQVVFLCKFFDTSGTDMDHWSSETSVLIRMLLTAISRADPQFSYLLFITVLCCSLCSYSWLSRDAESGPVSSSICRRWRAEGQQRRLSGYAISFTVSCLLEPESHSLVRYTVNHKKGTIIIIAINLSDANRLS